MIYKLKENVNVIYKIQFNRNQSAIQSNAENFLHTILWETLILHNIVSEKAKRHQLETK